MLQEELIPSTPELNRLKEYLASIAADRCRDEVPEDLMFLPNGAKIFFHDDEGVIVRHKKGKYAY